MQQKRREIIRVWLAQKGGLDTNIPLAVDAHDRPLRVTFTEGIHADGQGSDAHNLLADKGH